MTRPDEGFYFLLFILMLCRRQKRYIEIIYALCFFLTFGRGRKENIIRDNYAVKMNRHHQIGTLSEFVR
jgi:hypothetical protein